MVGTIIHCMIVFSALRVWATWHKSNIPALITLLVGALGLVFDVVSRFLLCQVMPHNYSSLLNEASCYLSVISRHGDTYRHLFTWTLYPPSIQSTNVSVCNLRYSITILCFIPYPVVGDINSSHSILLTNTL